MMRQRAAFKPLLNLHQFPPDSLNTKPNRGREITPDAHSINGGRG